MIVYHILQQCSHLIHNYIYIKLLNLGSDIKHNIL
jgi:hypothetical protein